MKSRVLAVAAAASMAVAVTGAQAPQAGSTQQKTMNAMAEIKGKGISGTAQLTERREGSGVMVEITLDVKGLTPGRHGVHLHQTGKCEPEFTAAGGHFDPGPASNTDPDANHPFHMGDIPNLDVGSDGRGQMKILTSRVTLSEGPLSVFDADGTAIIVHGNEDQGITGKPGSGVSGGPRVACGVVVKK